MSKEEHKTNSLRKGKISGVIWKDDCVGALLVLQGKESFTYQLLSMVAAHFQL